MDEKKRKFIKLAMAGIGTAVVGGLVYKNADKFNLLDRQTLAQSQQNYADIPDDPNRHWGFIIDTGACDGCENLDPPEDDPTGEKPRCSYACRTSHHYLYADPPQYWIRVYKLHENPLHEFFFPKPCMNCEDAPCQNVCPTGATFKRQDGTVLINHDICIGCRICMAACPYETRFFWYNSPAEDNATVPEGTTYSPEFPVPHTRGTVAKCDYCIHKVYDNQLPHCVTACPTGALYFGDLNENAVSNGREVIPVAETVHAYGGYRYKEDENTHPSIYYLPPTHLDALKATSIEVDFSIKDKDANIIVKAIDASNRPVKFGVITILRKSTFGMVEVAEGATNSSGILRAKVELNGSNELEFRLKESRTHQATKVIKNVK